MRLDAATQTLRHHVDQTAEHVRSEQHVGKVKNAAEDLARSVEGKNGGFGLLAKARAIPLSSSLSPPRARPVIPRDQMMGPAVAELLAAIKDMIKALEDYQQRVEGTRHLRWPIVDSSRCRRLPKSTEKTAVRKSGSSRSNGKPACARRTSTGGINTEPSGACGSHHRALNGLNWAHQHHPGATFVGGCQYVCAWLRSHFATELASERDHSTSKRFRHHGNPWHHQGM